MTSDVFKDSKKDHDSKMTLVEEMESEMTSICDSLCCDTQTFNKIEITNKINVYLGSYNRILYHVITNCIYSPDHDTGVFSTNLQKVVEYVLSDEYNSTDDSIDTKKIMIKIWDHYNLANRQFNTLNQTDQDFTKKFNSKITPIHAKIEENLHTHTKEINSQLIALIGIFTAMSFLVFGGINSLNNIFYNAKMIPILNLMIIGSIWGLCILNLVFVFMFFISKMTGLDISSNKNKDSSLIKKYPLVIWSNLIICTILLICLLLYYIDRWNLGSWLYDFSYHNQILVFISGFLAITIIFIVCSIIILKR